MVPGDDRDHDILARLGDGPVHANHDDDASWHDLGRLLGVLMRAARAPRPDLPASREPGREAAEVFNYWDQPVPPPDVAACMASWRRSETVLRSYDHAAADEYLRFHYGGDVLAAFRYAHHPSMQSDILRMARLLRDGGLYVDADDEYVGSGSIPVFAAGSALMPLAVCRHCPQSLVPRADDPAADHAWYYLGSAPWFSVPRHPFVALSLERAVAAMTQRRKQGELAQIHRDVGPGCVSMAALDYARTCIRDGQVIDLSVATDWPFVVQSRLLAYKSTERNWRRNAVLYPHPERPGETAAAN